MQTRTREQMLAERARDRLLADAAGMVAAWNDDTSMREVGDDLAHAVSALVDAVAEVGVGWPAGDPDHEREIVGLLQQAADRGSGGAIRWPWWSPTCRERRAEPTGHRPLMLMVDVGGRRLFRVVGGDGLGVLPAAGDLVTVPCHNRVERLTVSARVFDIDGVLDGLMLEATGGHFHFSTGRFDHPGDACAAFDKRTAVDGSPPELPQSVNSTEMEAIRKTVIDFGFGGCESLAEAVHAMALAYQTAAEQDGKVRHERPGGAR